MKNKYSSGIYRITNKANGKSYVGSSTALERRFSEHKYRLNTGTHHTSYLQRSWNKYGAGAFRFDILFLCDPNNCLLFEQRTLDFLKPEYNAKGTARSPGLGATHSAETRAKMSKNRKGKGHGGGRIGRHYKTSPETRAKRRQERLEHLFNLT